MSERGIIKSFFSPNLEKTMVKDSEKGIGYLIGYEEPGTAEKRKAPTFLEPWSVVAGARTMVPGPGSLFLSLT